ncbi:MAG: hypothetical protein JNL74_23815 [Fibrobacteres bacterium]|nr:hypothetical protein [Fibrobacterota bacterium]
MIRFVFTSFLIVAILFLSLGCSKIKTVEIKNDKGTLVKKYSVLKADTTLIDGIYEEWFDNGKQKEQKVYVNGKEEGAFTIWYPNGLKATEGVYKAGQVATITNKYPENYEIAHPPLSKADSSMIEIQFLGLSEELTDIFKSHLGEAYEGFRKLEHVRGPVRVLIDYKREQPIIQVDCYVDVTKDVTFHKIIDRNSFCVYDAAHALGVVCVLKQRVLADIYQGAHQKHIKYYNNILGSTYVLLINKNETEYLVQYGKHIIGYPWPQINWLSPIDIKVDGYDETRIKNINRPALGLQNYVIVPGNSSNMDGTPTTNMLLYKFFEKEAP